MWNIDNFLVIKYFLNEKLHVFMVVKQYKCEKVKKKTKKKRVSCFKNWSLQLGQYIIRCHWFYYLFGVFVFTNFHPKL